MASVWQEISCCACSKFKSKCNCSWNVSRITQTFYLAHCCCQAATIRIRLTLPEMVCMENATFLIECNNNNNNNKIRKNALSHDLEPANNDNTHNKRRWELKKEEKNERSSHCNSMSCILLCESLTLFAIMRIGVHSSVSERTDTIYDILHCATQSAVVAATTRTRNKVSEREIEREEKVSVLSAGNWQH